MTLASVHIIITDILRAEFVYTIVGQVDEVIVQGCQAIFIFLACKSRQSLNINYNYKIFFEKNLILRRKFSERHSKVNLIKNFNSPGYEL